MILNKWDFTKHKYLPFKIPDEWVIILHSDDMDMTINCTNCGKEMDYGQGYTSRTIHTSMGFGYPVCEECYEVEFKNEEANKEKRQS